MDIIQKEYQPLWAGQPRGKKIPEEYILPG